MLTEESFDDQSFSGTLTEESFDDDAFPIGSYAVDRPTAAEPPAPPPAPAPPPDDAPSPPSWASATPGPTWASADPIADLPYAEPSQPDPFPPPTPYGAPPATSSFTPSTTFGTGASFGFDAGPDDLDDDRSLAPSTFAPSSNPAPAPPAPPASAAPPAFGSPASPTPAFGAEPPPFAAAEPEHDGPGKFVPFSAADEVPRQRPVAPSKVNQNKLLTIGVGVVAVLILGGVGYAVVSNSSSPTTKATGSTLPPLSSLSLATQPPLVVVPPTSAATTIPPAAPQELVWAPLTAPDGSFTIELPGTPTQSGGDGPPDQPSVTRFQVDLPQGFYLFGYVDRKGAGGDADAAIDAGIETLRAAARGQTTVNEPADVHGQKAHHFTILTSPTAQSDTFEGYVVLTPKRLFVIGYGYRRERKDPAVLERMLGTFNFT